ncbi:UNVERIFIED_CONTAM: tRNase Z TRZ1 [Sesamum radiatum]|uniref:TRNase Z TRZ1 n=1 Tax=Sesamum radiatum TaxID=300843 RepID=A0AAW2Q119_SESRA
MALFGLFFFFFCFKIDCFGSIFIPESSRQGQSGWFEKGKWCSCRALQSTYVEDTCTVEDARDYGHTHLAEIINYADKFENKAILLIHFSARYQLDVIENAVSALPPPLAGRVFALTKGF